MFVEYKDAVEVPEAPAKTLKLSEAIRIGARCTVENPNVYLESSCGCAIGLGASGLGANSRVFWGWRKLYLFVQEKTGIPWEILEEVNTRHSNAREPATQITDWLESLGY
jgi:hypothetical protein